MGGLMGCATPAQKTPRSEDFYQTRLTVTTGGAEESAAAVKRTALWMKKISEELRQSRAEAAAASQEIMQRRLRIQRGGR